MCVSANINRCQAGAGTEDILASANKTARSGSFPINWMRQFLPKCKQFAALNTHLHSPTHTTAQIRNLVFTSADSTKQQTQDKCKATSPFISLTQHPLAKNKRRDTVSLYPVASSLCLNLKASGKETCCS